MERFRPHTTPYNLLASSHTSTTPIYPCGLALARPAGGADVVVAGGAAGERHLDGGRGLHRARSHCRFALLAILFISYSLTYAVPLFLKRQCDRNLGLQRDPGAPCSQGARPARGDTVILTENDSNDSRMTV